MTLAFLNTSNVRAPRRRPFCFVVACTIYGLVVRGPHVNALMHMYMERAQRVYVYQTAVSVRWQTEGHSQSRPLTCSRPIRSGLHHSRLHTRPRLNPSRLNRSPTHTTTLQRWSLLQLAIIERLIIIVWHCSTSLAALLVWVFLRSWPCVASPSPAFFAESCRG